MKVILNKRDLIEALEGLRDNDAVVIDLDVEFKLRQDLYSFSVYVVGGIELEDGEVINEIRIVPVENKGTDSPPTIK